MHSHITLKQSILALSTTKLTRVRMPPRQLRGPCALPIGGGMRAVSSLAQHRTCDFMFCEHYEITKQIRRYLPCSAMKAYGEVRQVSNSSRLPVAFGARSFLSSFLIFLTNHS